MSLLSTRQIILILSISLVKAVFDQMLDFSNLVLSYHNFEETPENLMELLSEMTNLTPRVVKVAVMPKHEQDVLDLYELHTWF